MQGNGPERISTNAGESDDYADAMLFLQIESALDHLGK